MLLASLFQGTASITGGVRNRNVNRGRVSISGGSDFKASESWRDSIWYMEFPALDYKEDGG
jgi:hypothetical protein